MQILVHLNNKPNGDRKIREKRLAEEQFQNQLYPIQENIKIELSKHIEEPIAPEIKQSPIRNLTYRFYHIPMEDIPDNFDRFDFIADGSIFNNLLSLAPASKKKYIGLVFEGMFDSSRGCNLYIPCKFTRVM